MLEYILKLSKDTNISVSYFSNVVEQLRFFTKDKQIIKQYLHNTYSEVKYDKNKNSSYSIN